MDLDLNKKVSSPRCSEDAREEEESVCLSLSLSIGCQPMAKRSELQLQPPPQQPMRSQQPPPPNRPQQLPSFPGTIADPPSHRTKLNFTTSPSATSHHRVPLPLSIVLPCPTSTGALIQSQVVRRPSPPHKEDDQQPSAAPDVRPPRKRGEKVAGPQEKAETVVPPYPWATDRRAIVHPYTYLISNGMMNISGELKCRACHMYCEIQYNLETKFAEVREYIAKNWECMHKRAPGRWLIPTLPNCQYCKETDCLRPMTTKKKAINWLFLFLWELLGCCKMSELRYFLKHTDNNLGGNRRRQLLYNVYMGVSQQLDPMPSIP